MDRTVLGIMDAAGFSVEGMNIIQGVCTMNLPNRNNPYTFAGWLKNRRVNYFTADEFLQRCMKFYLTEEDYENLKVVLESFAEKVSFRWADLVEVCARVENRPYLMQYDAYGNRVDRIVRPLEMHILEKEIFAEGLYRDSVGPWERFLKMLLLMENGEYGVMCPQLCTEGLIRAIEELTTPETRRPELERILRHCKDGIDGDFGIGAQFLSEIQGGSDVPANLLEAEFDGENWRLFGTKFFCSAIHADYFIITAKPAGSEKVAMFVMPAWLPGNKEKEIRNGYTIDRLKWKLGTVELPTAEVTFKGGVAYPLGDLERGVSNVVGIVLSYSRLGVGATTAGMIIRAVREAKMYSEFREAFGTRIDRFPLLVNQLRQYQRIAERATAGAFKVYDHFLKAGGRFTTRKDPNESLEMKKQRFALRELVLFAKIYNSKVSTQVIHDCMSVFGGHGAMEDFTALPRLYRDSNINELWEGPRNVLLTQIHNDFRRNSNWYSAREFIATILAGAERDTIEYLTDRMERLLGHPNLYTLDEETIEIAGQWDGFADELMTAFQEQARREVLQGV